MTDGERILIIRKELVESCRKNDCELTTIDIELNADQYSEDAELYLRHAGNWHELLGLQRDQVRINIGGPYRWPPP